MPGGKPPEVLKPLTETPTTATEPRGIGQIFKDIYGGRAFGAEQRGISGIGSSLIGGAAWGFTIHDAKRRIRKV